MRMIRGQMPAAEVAEAERHLDECEACRLLGLGRVAMDDGKARDALPYFTRALALREAKDTIEVNVAEARFSLARALWETGDRRRARELALRAKDAYARGGKEAAAQLQELSAWLAGK